jgi:hypothetical protein
MSIEDYWAIFAPFNSVSVSLHEGAEGTGNEDGPLGLRRCRA